MHLAVFYKWRCLLSFVVLTHHLVCIICWLHAAEAAGLPVSWHHMFSK